MDTHASASKKSIKFQGGLFRAAELERFRNETLRDEIVALKFWDDAATVPDIQQATPMAREYLSLVVEHLEKQDGVVV